MELYDSGSRHFRLFYTNTALRFRIHCCSGVFTLLVVIKNRLPEYNWGENLHLKTRNKRGGFITTGVSIPALSLATCETIFMVLFLFASFIWITLCILSWLALTNKQWIAVRGKVETYPGYSSPLIHWQLTADTCDTAENSFRDGWLIIIYNILHFYVVLLKML